MQVFKAKRPVIPLSIFYGELSTHPVACLTLSRNHPLTTVLISAIITMSTTVRVCISIIGGLTRCVTFAILFLACVGVDGMVKRDITPRYEFGFGLSYTSFSYSALKITSLGGLSGGFQAPTGAGSSLSAWSVFQSMFKRQLCLSSIC